MSRSKRATQRQLEAIVDFVNKHRELIDGRLSPPTFTAQMRDKLWQELACLLNDEKYGPAKSPNKWRRSWIDLKYEAKARAASMHEQQNQGENVKPLTPLLLKINNMISGVPEEENSEIEKSVVVEPVIEYIKKEEITIETDGCGSDETSTENSIQNESIPGLSITEVRTVTDLTSCRPRGRRCRIFKKSRDRASQRQLELMVDFVSNHREMISRKFSASFTAQKRARLWEELTCLLNSDKLGPVKTSFKWRRTWIDLKCEAKARAIAILKHNQTGEGTNLRPLNPLFEKIINIISLELEGGNSEISEAARLVNNIKGNSAEETTEIDSNGVDGIVEDLFQNESMNEPSTSENITDTDSTSSLYLKSKQHFVSAESLTNFLEIEKEKVAALKALAKEKKIANSFRERQLKIEEERNALYSRRTELFVNIANAFLEKF